jgi:hypothetical protein
MHKFWNPHFFQLPHHRKLFLKEIPMLHFILQIHSEYVMYISSCSMIRNIDFLKFNDTKFALWGDLIISLVRIIGTHKLNTNLQTKTCKICWTTHCRAVAFLIWDYFHTDKKMLQLSISRNGSHIGSRTVLLDTILKVSHPKNHLSPSWRNSVCMKIISN